jgi:AcrR family transcriptional regulator
MSETPPKRTYHSPHRQAQAAATRQRILAAAERLFVEHGFPATTLAAIAREARVALPTVTAAFGTKLALLNALIATTVRGDEAPIPLPDRDWWRAALDEPDPQQLCRHVAANARRIHERTTDIFEIVRGAAAADPEMARLRRELAVGRLRDCRLVADALTSRGALRPDVTVEQAADLIWTFGSAELYRMLVAERGWSPGQYEQWLATTLIESVLAAWVSVDPMSLREGS